MKALFLVITSSVFLSALWSSNASAQGGYQMGIIARVYGGPQLGTRIVFRINSSGGVARGNIPGCSIYNDEWALDLATESGRLAYGIIQDALHERVNLQVYALVRATLWAIAKTCASCTPATWETPTTQIFARLKGPHRRNNATACSLRSAHGSPSEFN
jgi:hypothetical protein